MCWLPHHSSGVSSTTGSNTKSTISSKRWTISAIWKHHHLPQGKSFPTIYILPIFRLSITSEKTFESRCSWGNWTPNLWTKVQHGASAPPVLVWTIGSGTSSVWTWNLGLSSFYINQGLTPRWSHICLHSVVISFSSYRSSLMRSSLFYTTWWSCLYHVDDSWIYVYDVEYCF